MESADFIGTYGNIVTAQPIVMPGLVSRHHVFWLGVIYTSRVFEGVLAAAGMCLLPILGNGEPASELVFEATLAKAHAADVPRYRAARSGTVYQKAG